MGRIYALELDRLHQTIEFSSLANIEPLAEIISKVLFNNSVFIGSGGSFTAATFAAILHEYYSGQISKAITPLEAVIRPNTENTAAILLSARGSNPDIIKAYRALRSSEKLMAICASERNALLRLINEEGSGIGYGFNVPGGKDGFLATNSLVATMIYLARGYRAACGLSDLDFSDLCIDSLDPEQSSHRLVDFQQLMNANTIITLSSGWGWPAAIDIESKCSEAGLSNVLLSDYRNFSHGRHNWLRKRGDSTVVLSLEDKTNTQLASSVLSLIPEDIRIFRITSGKSGSEASIELVCKMLYLTQLLGLHAGLDPGRPFVAMFGRKMYRNGFQVSKFPSIHSTWVARKAAAIGILPHQDNSFLYKALDRFLNRLRKAIIKAVIVDYDGTLCDPSERFVDLTCPPKTIPVIIS